MRMVGSIAVLLAVAGPVAAGELLLANGSRVAGELASDALMVSTGADLIEVRAEQVGLLTPAEIRLKDGRVISGTVVGGRLRARTTLGELSIRTEELSSYRADGFGAAGPGTPAVTTDGAAPAAAMGPLRVTAAGSEVPARATAVPAAPVPPASDGTLPPVTLYQTPTPAPPEPRAEPAPARVAALPPDPTVEKPVTGERLEVVVGESLLRRDAIEGGRPVGRVVRGQLLTLLDYVDRRLRVFNRLVFDGGHWIKVRALDGTVGWLPADAVREVK